MFDATHMIFAQMHQKKDAYEWDFAGKETKS
jgi:hypothetical protein